jgi:hypothetical protein
MRSATLIQRELSEVVEAGIKACNDRDAVRSKRLEDQALRLHTELKDARREQAIRSIGSDTGATVQEPTLGDALLKAGFDRVTHPAVAVPQRHALGVDFKAGSVDGGIDGDEIEDVFISPLLGVDNRYLFTQVRTQGVSSDETGVRSFRQRARNLASTTDMIRTIAATTTKPETDTTAEVVNEPLKQIATVSKGTPNVLLANDAFRSWVNADLLTAYRRAVDAHIVTEVAAAGIQGGGGGANAFEDVLYSQEVVRAAGYSPNAVVLSPADALAIQLLQLSGGDSYVFAQPAPSFVVTPAVADGEGFVADTAALGILFLSPFSLQAFEENSGQTNTSTVRAESNGLFLVQRPDAAATLSAS